MHPNVSLPGIHAEDQIDGRGGQAKTLSPLGCLGVTKPFITLRTVKKSKQGCFALTMRLLGSHSGGH
jgi:hypothetical protein